MEQELERSFKEMGGTDSWNLVKDYLQSEGIMTVTDEVDDDEDEMSYHDSSYEDDDDMSEEDQEEEVEEEEDFHESEEEEEEEEYSDYEIQDMEQLEPEHEHQHQPLFDPEVSSTSSDIPPLPIFEPSTPTIPIPISTIPEPTNTPLPPQPPQQTQSPPITPDQLPHPRKRHFLETQDPVAPVPTTTIVPSTIPEPEDPPAESVKRRRIDDQATGRQGWLGVAKTVGKYTVAGAVGGAATFLGLLWSAQ